MLEVKNLKKYFQQSGGLFSKKQNAVRAVDDISFDLFAGETLGLVGESGSGKSTTGRTILRLISPTGGEVIYNGHDILKSKDLEEIREVHKTIQMIFQDPYASLNPRMRVGDAIAESLITHKLMSSEDAKKRAYELLAQVELDPTYYDRFPHQFSGGQRQRIGIARALALDPKIIICDEPVSALDVSVQAQIINLFKDLQEKLGLTYLFIAHDLSVVKYISTRIAVMYLGEIVELTGKEELFADPRHPYTQALISAIPMPDPEASHDRIILQGDIPSPSNPPTGCKFHNRCTHCMDICKEQHPELVERSEGHFVRCHLYNTEKG